MKRRNVRQWTYAVFTLVLAIGLCSVDSAMAQISSGRGWGAIWFGSGVADSIDPVLFGAGPSFSGAASFIPRAPGVLFATPFYPPYADDPPVPHAAGDLRINWDFNGDVHWINALPGSFVQQNNPGGLGGRAQIIGYFKIVFTIGPAGVPAGPVFNRFLISGLGDVEFHVHVAYFRNGGRVNGLDVDFVNPLGGPFAQPVGDPGFQMPPLLAGDKVTVEGTYELNAKNGRIQIDG